MNFGLLWLDALAITLLWVAGLTACIARIRRRWIRITLTLLVALIPLAVLGVLVFGSAALKFSMEVRPNYFNYSVSLLVACLIGTVVILRRAARREPSIPPAAAAWRRGPLAFAWLTAAAVGYMTLVNMDLAIRARCAILSVQLNSVYFATLPAITSDSQNAAPLYEAAFALIHEAKEDERKIQNPPTGNNIDFDPNEPATISYLSKHANIIALLRRAAALPACRFDADLNNSDITLVLPSLSGSRSAANILQLDAREEISRGHAAAAIDDANAIFGFSRHIGQRPFLVAAHVGMGIDALGGYTLGLALPVVKTRDELARLHLEELTSLAHIFQQGLRSEERFGLTLYGNMLGLQITTAANHDYRLATVPPLGSGWGGVFFRAFLLDLDSYTKFMEDMQDAATQPYYKIQGQISDAFGLGRERGLVLSIVEPALNRTLQMLATGEVYDACDQTAVAMTKYRLDHGMLPSHLGDLVPAYLDAVPTDPFDGHPLRLVVRNGEWIIYSVGPDGIDNGGTRIDRSRYDILFTLKPTATRAATQP